MQPQFTPSRLVVSLVTFVIVMSSAPASAQSENVPAEQPPSPGPSRTIVSIKDNGDELLRPQVFNRPLLDPGDGLAQAPSTGQSAKQRDSLLNGVLIGAGIGALLGLIPDYYDDCEECHDSLYASIAVGAGIGLVIDLLRSDTKPTRSLSGQRFRVDIAGGRRAVGVRGIYRWR